MNVRFWLALCLTLIFTGCSSSASVQPTLRGPIVPTRLIPTNTPTSTPTDTPTPTPTATFTDTPSNTPTEVPSPTDTPEPTHTNTVPPPTEIPSPTDTPEPTHTNTVPPPTEVPSPTNTPEPTNTNTVPPPTEIPSPTDTPEPTITNTEPPRPTDIPVADLTVFRSATSFEPAYIYGAATLGTPISGTVDDEHPAILFSFDATAGMIVDIAMTAQSRATSTRTCWCSIRRGAKSPATTTWTRNITTRPSTG